MMVMVSSATGETFTPILCVDFDGVVNSYKSGMLGGNQLPDPPVPGALKWLWTAMNDWDVQIYSSRSKDDGGIEAMKTWFMKHAAEEWNQTFARKFVDCLKFPTQKPMAFLTIDDRAICFQGKWDELDPKQLLKFRSWVKRDKA